MKVRGGVSGLRGAGLSYGDGLEGITDTMTDLWRARLHRSNTRCDRRCVAVAPACVRLVGCDAKHLTVEVRVARLQLLTLLCYSHGDTSRRACCSRSNTSRRACVGWQGSVCVATVAVTHAANVRAIGVCSCTNGA